MTRRGDRDLLLDILSAGDDILAFTAGLGPDAFLALPENDRKTYRAVKNALAEIGEAIKRLSPELAARRPEIDWRGWAGLRDVVAHEYFRLELPLLRPTIADELPQLLATVRAELAGWSYPPADLST